MSHHSFKASSITILVYSIDLRKLSLKDAKQLLRKFQVPDSEVSAGSAAINHT